jgi:hypothetical protein
MLSCVSIGVLRSIVATVKFGWVQTREPYEFADVEAHGIIDAPRFEFTAHDKLVELAEADAQHLGCLLAVVEQPAKNQDEYIHKTPSRARFVPVRVTVLICRPIQNCQQQQFFSAAAFSLEKFFQYPGPSLSVSTEATVYPHRGCGMLMNPEQSRPLHAGCHRRSTRARHSASADSSHVVDL